MRFMLLVAGTLAIIAQAEAQTMYRCGSVYQDRPCDAGAKSKVVGSTGSASAAPAPAAGVDPECGQRARDSQKIVWAREGGATEERLPFGGALGERAPADPGRLSPSGRGFDRADGGPGRLRRAKAARGAGGRVRHRGGAQGSARRRRRAAGRHHRVERQGESAAFSRRARGRAPRAADLRALQRGQDRLRGRSAPVAPAAAWTRASARE